LNEEPIPRSYKAIKSFRNALDSISEEKRSKIILALDLDYREDTTNLLRDAKKIIRATSDYICAVKINHHLMLPLSIADIASLNKSIAEEGLLSIADLKLNDIDNTNRVATEYLWAAGFSAVIVNPFAGYPGALDVVFKNARQLGKGVITLAYMSHKGADEGYGLKLESGKTIFDEFLERAKRWGSDGVILGTTRPEKIRIASKTVGKKVKIICPGTGAQGGDSFASIGAGADYLIFGRSIVLSVNPRSAVKQIFQSIASTMKN